MSSFQVLKVSKQLANFTLKPFLLFFFLFLFLLFLLNTLVPTQTKESENSHPSSKNWLDTSSGPSNSKFNLTGWCQMVVLMWKSVEQSHKTRAIEFLQKKGRTRVVNGRRIASIKVYTSIQALKGKFCSRVAFLVAKIKHSKARQVAPRCSDIVAVTCNISSTGCCCLSLFMVEQ